MASPDVSIITTAYNSEEYIHRALESVRQQTIAKSAIEHIVVDDGSTDETANIVKEFGAPYLRLIQRDGNYGATKALNLGIDHAQGDYLVVLDSDDEFLPPLVEKMRDVLTQNASVDFVYCNYYEQSANGRRLVVDTSGNILNTVTIGIMHRSEHLYRFDKYDPNMHFSEYDLLLRYLDAGLNGFHIPEPLFIYHRRRDSQTSDESWVELGEQELRTKYGCEIDIRDY